MKEIVLIDFIRDKFSSMESNDIYKVKISLMMLGFEMKVTINDQQELIEEYDIPIKSIDYKGIGEIVNLTDLEVILFEEHLNIEEISELKGLKKLKINGHNLKDITFLKGLTNLTELVIPKKRENDVIVDISVLGELQNLISLQVGCLKLNGCEAISKLRKLEYLGLGNTGIDNVEFIKELCQIKELQLFNNEKLNSLKGLEQLVLLKKLDLANIGSKAKFDEVGELVNLVELDLSCNKAYIDIVLLENLKKLKVLCLELSKVKNFEYINELSALKELRMETVKTVKDFTSIGELSYLETLVLRKNRQLTDISFLAPLKNLKHLEIYECGKIEDYSAVEHVEKVVM